MGGKVISDTELAVIFRYLNLKLTNSKIILDIGTGTGRVAREIIKSSESNVIGIDLNKYRLKLAAMKKKCLRNYADRYDLVVADGHFLPFKDSIFDSIVCIRSIKYFSDYELGIREMSRVLKEGGVLVLTLSNVFSIDFLLLRLRLLAYKILFNFYFMKNIFEHCGFAIVDFLGLHKIHPKIWTVSNNSHFIAFLKAAELILQKITPKVLFSREILVKLIKS